jgi:cell surface protein SprA
LVEGVDFTVNYQAGRVQILDPSLQASNTPIEVSVENNSVFGQQTRRFMGINVEHKFSPKALVGATFLKMTERPFTQKSNYGQESVNNSMFGLNTSLSSEVPFLTRLVNKLPNVDTDVPSNVSFRGEVAFLKPDAPIGDRFNGESTLYVDDFEGSQTNIDLRSPLSWFIASTPERPATGNVDYPDFNGTQNSIDYGFKRAKIAWYTIDPVFYTQRPSGVSQDGVILDINTDSNWSKGTSSLSKKYLFSSVTERLINCLFVFSLFFDFGKVILITFGFAKVEIIKKNNKRKNMMSLKEEVATSA